MWEIPEPEWRMYGTIETAKKIVELQRKNDQSPQSFLLEAMKTTPSRIIQFDLKLHQKPVQYWLFYYEQLSQTLSTFMQSTKLEEKVINLTKSLSQSTILLSASG